MLAIEWMGRRLELLGDRAVHRPESSTLYVADTHFGKAAAFRAGGVPVPAGTTAATLARLDRLLDRTDARRLVILGDFLHDREGRAPETMDRLAAWRDRHAGLAIDLVRGNHDRRAGDPPTAWGLRVLDEPARDPDPDAPWSLCHDPGAVADDGPPVLAGHVHPVHRLRVPGGGGGLRFPCFLVRPRLLLLPAFGRFTGGALVQPMRGDRLFAVDPEEAEGDGDDAAIIEVPIGRAVG